MTSVVTVPLQNSGACLCREIVVGNSSNSTIDYSARNFKQQAESSRTVSRRSLVRARAVHFSLSGFKRLVQRETWMKLTAITTGHKQVTERIVSVKNVRVRSNTQHVCVVQKYGQNAAQPLRVFRPRFCTMQRSPTKSNRMLQNFSCSTALSPWPRSALCHRQKCCMLSCACSNFVPLPCSRNPKLARQGLVVLVYHFFRAAHASKPSGKTDSSGINSRSHGFLTPKCFRQHHSVLL